MIFFLTLIILAACLIWWKWLRKAAVSTATGASVMALGIMISGAFQESDFLRHLASYATACMVAMLFALFACYSRDLLVKKFYERHLQHPIASFATGTWIAATSVTVIAIANVWPQLRSGAFVLYGVNVLLVIAYVMLVFRNYVRLFAERVGSNVWFMQAHGVMLLACVAVQSMVVSGLALFGERFPKSLALGLILFGILLYLIGLAVILNRYFCSKRWRLTEHWENTNCILHGAMSITGLASAMSHLAPNWIAWIWLWVLVWFVVVEMVEIWRAVLRVRLHGLKRGLLRYSVSQWSRNFTFGMLLAFTMHFSLDGSFLNRAPWQTVRSGILHGGLYVVVALFAVEVVLYLQERLPGRERIDLAA